MEFPENHNKYLLPQPQDHVPYTSMNDESESGTSPRLTPVAYPLSPMENVEQNNEDPSAWSHSSLAAFKRFLRATGLDSTLRSPGSATLAMDERAPRITYGRSQSSADELSTPSPHTSPNSFTSSAAWQSFLRNTAFRFHSMDETHMNELTRPRSPSSVNSNNPLSLIPKELSDQIRKGVTFTANVVGGAVGVPELRGVPDAPRASKVALDLADAALQVRRNQNRDMGLDEPPDGLEGFFQTLARGRRFNRLHTTSIDEPCTEFLHEKEEKHEKPPVRTKRVCASSALPAIKNHNRRRTRKGIVRPHISIQRKRSVLVPSIKSVVIGPHVIHAPKAEPSMEQIRILPTTGKPRPSPAQLNRLVFMSFNAGLLEYRLGGITWYRNPPFTKRRLYQIAPCLRQAGCDLVALQEIYEEWQADYLVESLRITFPFVARRRSGGSLSLHNGLMILSRFPILRTAFHPFASVTAIERVFGSKGMLEATVEIPTVGQVTFVNIHLASGAVDPESTSLEALRNEEIEEVLCVCQTASARGEIPIIIGDLNAAPNLCPSNYRKLCEYGWRDAFLGAIQGDAAADPATEVAALDVCWKGRRDFRRNDRWKRTRGDAKLTTTGKIALAKRFLQGRFRSPATYLLKRKILLHTNGIKKRRPSYQQPSKVLLPYHPSWKQNNHTNSLSDNDINQATTLVPNATDDSLAPLPLKSDTVYQNDSHIIPIDNKDYVNLDNFDAIYGRQPQSNIKKASFEIYSDYQQKENPKFTSPFETVSSDVTTSDDINSNDLPLTASVRTLFPRYRSNTTEHQCLLNKGNGLQKHRNQRYLRNSKICLIREISGWNSAVANARIKISGGQVSGKVANFVKTASRVLGCDPEEMTYMENMGNPNKDPFCTKYFTWDPQNPLNMIGPHSECHGLRCDHIFLPPKKFSRGLADFHPSNADVCFTEPQVTVEGCCCGLLGQASIVTLSDHYAIRIELLRR